jgi:hypothetical protein
MAEPYTIEQSLIGQIGGAVGDCYAFGAAIHNHHVVYLDMAGAAASVESVWARLAQGQAVRIIALDDPEQGTILLQPAENGTLKRF